MMVSSAGELARASVVAELLSRDLDHLGVSDWRLFGSWAIALQSDWFSRFPNDIDVEVPLEADLDRVGAGWHLRHGPLQLFASPGRVVTFSSAQDVIAIWQEVCGVMQGQLMTREIVNWVWRGTTDKVNGDSWHPAVTLPSSDALRVNFGSALIDRDKMYSIEECFAQKWTRMTANRSGGRQHTRWVDVADLFDIAVLRSASLDVGHLHARMREQCAQRNLAWPPILPEPPAEWLDNWDQFGYRSHIDRGAPVDAVTRLNDWWLAQVERPPSSK